MNMIKNKIHSVLLPILILSFVTVAIHADTGKRSLFVANPDLFNGNSLPGLNNLPAAEQSKPMPGKPLLRSETVFLEVVAGMAGSVILGMKSAVLLDYIVPDRSESFVPATAIVGYCGGSLFGSALGVYLVGNSRNARGDFGQALLGSFFGEIAALGVMLLSRYNIGVYLLATAILPTAGAAILFNRSLRYRALSEGNGLFNLNKDKLTLGIPDMQIRPLHFFRKNVKAEFGFKINVLSVML